jgi:hypothetical protein
MNELLFSIMAIGAVLESTEIPAQNATNYFTNYVTYTVSSTFATNTMLGDGLIELKTDTGWADGNLTNIVILPKYRGTIQVGTNLHPATNLVASLCKSGEVCKQIGHNWRNGRPGEGEGSTFADYHPGTTFRTCGICGVCQSQTLGEWK